MTSPIRKPAIGGPVGVRRGLPTGTPARPGRFATPGPAARLVTGFRLGLALLTGLALAGCGDGSQVIVRPPPAGSPLTPAATAAPTASSPAAAGQRVVVTPASGLLSKQTVHVAGEGFTPGESLVITECAVKGAKTSAADCNVAGLLPVVADSYGRVSAEFPVTKGPFGANNVVCAGEVRCLVSVTQATLAPTEEADTQIRFN